MGGQTGTGPSWQGVSWALSAAVMYAAMNAFGKVGHLYLTVWQMAMGRFILGLLVLIPLALVLKIDLWGSHRGLHLIRSGSAVISFLLLLTAFKTVPVSEAIVIFYTWPAFISLLSGPVVGEPTRAWEWPFIAAAFMGSALVIWPEGGGFQPAQGHLLSLTGALFGSVAVILVRRLGRDNNPFAIFFYLCLVGGVAGLFPWLKAGLAGSDPLLPGGGTAWLVLLLMAGPSVLCQLFMNKGFQYLRAPQMGVLMTMELPLVAGFGVLALGEPLSWRLLTGAALVIISGLILNLSPFGKQ